MNKQIGKNRTISKAFGDRDDIVRWDVLAVDEGQTVKVTFLSANSVFRQGIRIAVDVGEGHIDLDGEQAKGYQLWQDTAPAVIVLKCFASEGVISVYNIWDMGRGVESQAHTSGMLIEQEGKRRMYRCNDYGLETDFDKLVFMIEMT